MRFIKCSERLPEQGEKVLLKLKNGNFASAVYAVDVFLLKVFHYIDHAIRICDAESWAELTEVDNEND